MTSANVNATIGVEEGADDVSNDILEMDIWGDDLKVGRWELLLKNVDNKYGDKLHTNEKTTLTINAIGMMEGYLDDALPHLDDRGVYTNQVMVKGRDYGRDLARLMYSGSFVAEKGDDLIDAILAAKGSEITFDSLHEGGYVVMERSRTYLIDWLQDVATRTNMNYSAYVAQNKALHFFPVGAAAEISGVALKLVAAALDNNILHLLKGEEIGFSIANSVELSAGPLNDHYTDGNHEAFNVSAGVYTPESCGVAGYYLDGTSSIKFGCLTDNDFMSIWLDFTSGLYNYDHFDLSRPEECYFLIKPVCHKAGSIWVNVRPWLEDGDGCRIEFKRTGVIPFLSAKGKTDDLSEGTEDKNWHKITFTVGDSDVKNVRRNNKWGKIAGTLPFDWTNVVKIGINVNCPGSWGAIDLYLDSLSIPSIEVISQGSDAVSIAAYGTSEWFDQRYDIKSQIELDAARANELEKRKDPLKNIQIIAKGQTGILYAGQSVTVQAPGHGIADATKYRIVSYHHQVRKDSIKGGFNFITTLDLISDELSPTTQVIDPRRYMLNKDPVGAALEILALTNRRLKTSEITSRKGFGDTLPVQKIFFSGSGTVFPLDPDDGFVFVLTADIASTHLAGSYKYVESQTIWVRQPAIFRRDTNPTFGQYEGDINENTTDGMDYKWTGSAWLRTTIKHTEGTTLPSSGMINGDTFYHTTLKRTYTYNGVSWEHTGGPSHLGILDVTTGQHHSKFTSGDHAGVEHATSMMAIELRRWGSNFNVSWDKVHEAGHYNDLYYGKAEAESTLDADIKFGDDTTDKITQKTEIDVPDGLWYLYWDEDFRPGDDYEVKRTDDILVAIGVGKGILATIFVDNAGEKPPGVICWGGYKPYLSVGFLVARSIDAGYLDANLVIGDVEIKTGDGVVWGVGGDPGVIITDLGMRGKGAGGAIMAQMLASSGKFSAGGVILDSSGFSAHGAASWYYDNSLLRGQIWAVWNEFADDIFNVYAPNAILRLVSDMKIVVASDVVPESTESIGTASEPFDDVYADTFHGVRLLYVGDETEKNVVGSVETEIKTFRVIRDDSHGVKPTRLYFVGEAKVTAGTGYLKVSVNGAASSTVWTFTNTSYAHQAGYVDLSLSDDTINTISVRLDNSSANTTHNRTLEAYAVCN